MAEIMNSRMENRDRFQTARELQNVQPTCTSSLTYSSKFPFSLGHNASDTPFYHY